MTETSAHRTRLWEAFPQGLAFEPLLLSSEDVRAARTAFASRGYVSIGPPAIDPGLHADLLTESLAQREVSAWELRGDGTDTMAQDNVRAQLGPLARDLMASSALRGLIRAVTGRTVIPGWSATCLTFYTEPGQFLDRHTDKHDVCSFAALVYLEASWPGDQPGRGVQLHLECPDHLARITARPNRLVLIHGSRIPHYRPPLAPGERVSLIAGCFADVEVDGRHG